MQRDPLLLALAPVIAGAVILMWRWASTQVGKWRAARAAERAAEQARWDEVHHAITVELPGLRHDLVTHMGNEEELRRLDQLDREQRQAAVDSQFAHVRQEIAQGITSIRLEVSEGFRQVHERVDNALLHNHTNRD